MLEHVLVTRRTRQAVRNERKLPQIIAPNEIIITILFYNISYIIYYNKILI